MNAIAPAGPVRAPAAAGRALLEAVQRGLRHGQDLVALALHLSRLDPPAPRAHHRRIARAMLDETAQRYGGQVHALAGGDLVVLCERAPAPGPADPATLAATLARLFRIDAPAPGALLSLWSLDSDAAALLAYAAGQAQATPAGEAAAGEPARPALTATAADRLLGGDIVDLLARQTAILIGPSAGRNGMRPLYREISVAPAALEGRLAGFDRADATLARHFARTLERRLLRLLLAEAGGDRPRGTRLGTRLGDGAFAGGGTALHVGLTPEAVLSADFARFAAACGQAGAGAGVEVSLVEACADPDRFVRARAAVADAGFSFVLTGVSHLTLLLTDPAALGADLVKLDWSPRIETAPAADQETIAAAIRRLDPRRVVLHGASGEAALSWGLAQGIRRFQGRHVDAMLAAGRIAACPASAGCTLRQCLERAGGLSLGARSGCANPALLDSGERLAEPPRPPPARAHRQTEP